MLTRLKCQRSAQVKTNQHFYNKEITDLSVLMD